MVKRTCFCRTPNSRSQHPHILDLGILTLFSGLYEHCANEIHKTCMQTKHTQIRNLKRILLMYLGCRTQQGHAGTELEVPFLASTVSKMLFRTLGEKSHQGFTQKQTRHNTFPTCWTRLSLLFDNFLTVMRTAVF